MHKKKAASDAKRGAPWKKNCFQRAEEEGGFRDGVLNRALWERREQQKGTQGGMKKGKPKKKTSKVNSEEGKKKKQHR